MQGTAPQRRATQGIAKIRRQPIGNSGFPESLRGFKCKAMHGMAEQRRAEQSK